MISFVQFYMPREYGISCILQRVLLIPGHDFSFHLVFPNHCQGRWCRSYRYDISALLRASSFRVSLHHAFKQGCHIDSVIDVFLFYFMTLPRFNPAPSQNAIRLQCFSKGCNNTVRGLYINQRQCRRKGKLAY